MFSQIPCFLVILLIKDVLPSCFKLPATANTKLIQSTCGCKLMRFRRERLSEVINGKRAYCDHTSSFQDVFAKYDLLDEVVSIDFSQREITEVPKDFFPSKNAANLKNILELLFGENKISYIGPGAFQHFENLRSLNLSHNMIGRINKEMFKGLGKLQKLFLNYNIFPIVPGDAFQHLTSLRRLDLTSDYLVCNYLMKDFVLWYSGNRTIRNQIRLFGACKLPEKNQGKLLKRLKPESLSDETSRLPYFEIQPSHNQVVFAGDSLSMNCEGTDLSDSKVSWSLNGHPVEPNAELYEENIVLFYNRTTISSHIQLELAPKWSGTWNCTIRSNYSHDFEHVSIAVLQNTTVYCDREKVVNHFGDFDWPAAVNGAHIVLKCQKPDDILINGMNQHTARRSCLDGGQWSPGDYSACQYVDDVARLLDNAIHTNVTADNAVVICRATTNRLKSLTINQVIGVEKMCDFVQMCRQYPSKSNSDEMLKILVELASKTLTSPSDTMMTSQLSDHACHIINNVITTTAKELLLNKTTFMQATPNIAIAGYNFLEQSGPLQCNVSSAATVSLNCTNESSGLFKKLPQAGVFLPSTFPRDFHPSHNALLVVYRNGTLFQSKRSHTMTLEEYQVWKASQPINSSISSPLDGNLDEGKDFLTGIARKMLIGQEPEPTRYVTVSSVYSVATSGMTRKNLTRPMVLMFHTKERVSVVKWQLDHYIAMWDGLRWRKSSGQCRFVSVGTTNEQLNKNISIVECHVLGTFAILKNLDGRKNFNEHSKPAQSVRPTIYVGTSVLCLCLLAVMVTYVLFNSLVISRDARHMVINICFHLLLDALAFTIGIWRVDDKVLCHATGICLHYSSLSVLFWTVLSARNISKEMVAFQQPVSADPKPQRPILRFYLTGCGIPIIVCGITAAAKIQNYVGDGNKYCWLSWETSLYAFYAPSAVLAIGCLLVLLRILATLNCNNGKFNPHKTHKHYRNANFVGESTPLQGMGSSYHGSVTTDASSAMLHIHKEINNEQAFRTRLLGVALTLVFFIMTWLFAALSVAAPQMQAVKSTSSIFQQSSFGLESGSSETPDSSVDLNIVFSCLFATFAIATGVFMVIQHLTSRRDVLAKWKAISRCGKQPLVCQVAGRHSNDVDLIANIKSKGRKRDNAPTPSVTEGMTLETVLPGTTGEDTPQTNPASVRSLSDPQMTNAIHNGTFIVNSVRAEGLSAAKSEPRNGADVCLMSHSNSSYMKFPDGNRLHVGSHGSHHVGRPFVKHQRRHGNDHYYKHHHSTSGSKPVKLTNLQHVQHESSLTEHSFDDSLINMHTIPVVLQHNQPKLDNGMLYKKYQRIRKNLEARRNRQQKLTVLREYAQDPLTSNDESKDKDSPPKNSERTPLLDTLGDSYRNDDQIKEYIAINEYKKADMNEKLNGTNMEQPKYRTLLLSSPSRKKEETTSRISRMPPRKRRTSGNPNLASNYRKRKPSHRSERSTSDFGRRAKDHASSSKPRLGKKQQAAGSVPPSSGDANMSLHGIVESNNALPPVATETQKSHNYLTADSVLNNPFYVPSRKSSKPEAASAPQQAPLASTGQAKAAADVDVTRRDDAAEGDEGCSPLRNETTV